LHIYLLPTIRCNIDLIDRHRHAIAPQVAQMGKGPQEWAVESMNNLSIDKSSQK